MEIRCTERDFLPPQHHQDPPAGSARFEGVLSVVIGDPSQRVRRLPSIYLGPSLIFASRRSEDLLPHLERSLEIVRSAAHNPTYALTRVQLDGRNGLYARDMSVRDAFRRFLQRSGLSFSDEPFVRLSDSGFLAEGDVQLEPEFIILGHYDEEDPERVLETSGAFVPFTLAAFRLGQVSPDELRRLVELCKDKLVLSSANAPNLVQALRERLRERGSVSSI